MSHVRGQSVRHAALDRAAIFREVAAPASTAPDRAALIDARGTIVAINQSWRDLARQTRTPLDSVGPGVNYLDVCRRASSSSSDARQALAGIQSVINDAAQSFRMEYTCSVKSEESFYLLTVLPFVYAEARFAIVHTDITGLTRSRNESSQRLRSVTRRLINAQEEERQRISRDLHDDLGIRIVLLAFGVQHIMNQQPSSTPVRDELQELLTMTMDLSNTVRNLSHGLHPPVLQYAGIGEAIKSICDNFAKAGGLKIDVVTPDQRFEVPAEVSLCIFRVAQECLQNIAKHSEAKHARIVVECTPRLVRLKVSDTGKGFIGSEAAHSGGLGLNSMKERVRCLNGRLEIDAAPGAGTRVRVTIPLSRNES